MDHSLCKYSVESVGFQALPNPYWGGPSLSITTASASSMQQQILSGQSSVLATELHYDLLTHVKSCLLSEGQTIDGKIT